MAKGSNITLLMVLLACGAAHAFGQAVQYVPQGCSGLTVATSANYDSGSNSIMGSVTLSNPNTFDIPITQVQVMLANNIPVAPMYVTANCGGATNVPFSPIAYQLGTLTCYFSQPLPSNGPANSPSAWTSVRATATIGMSGASCPSPVTPISGYVPPSPPSPPTPPPSSTCPSPIQLTSSLSIDGNTVYGSVTFYNWGYSNINLSGVTYQLNPSIVVAPLFGSVNCPSLTVPWNPTVGAAGTLRCTFTADVSSAPSNINWNSALVKATLVGGSVCPSPVVPINQLLGGK